MVYITGDIHGDISFFKNPVLRRLTEKTRCSSAATLALSGTRTMSRKKRTWKS